MIIAKQLQWLHDHRAAIDGYLKPLQWHCETIAKER